MHPVQRIPTQKRGFSVKFELHLCKTLNTIAPAINSKDQVFLFK